MLSFKRLGLLLRKHWIENYRIYLMGMGIIAGFTILIFLLVFYTEDGRIEEVFQMGYYSAGLFLCGTIFTSYIFNDFSQKPKGILFLTLPGSSLEKFLSLWLYATIGFVIVYSLIFYAVAIPFVKVSQSYNADELVRHSKFYNSRIQVLNFFQSEKEFYYLFFPYFFIQAVFLLGSVWFERFSFIKTAISGLLIVALFTFSNYAMGRVLIGEESVTAIPFHLLRHSYITARLPESIMSVIEFVAKYCVTPFLWFITYLKVAEKEL